MFLTRSNKSISHMHAGKIFHILKLRFNPHIQQLFLQFKEVNQFECAIRKWIKLYLIEYTVAHIHPISLFIRNWNHFSRSTHNESRRQYTIIWFHHIFWKKSFHYYYLRNYLFCVKIYQERFWWLALAC